MFAKRRELVVAVLLVAMLVVVLRLVSGVSAMHDGAETQYVYDAVHNAALTCYAVEGAYPEKLDYLYKNYGLAYDQSRYLVIYDAFASNQMPEIRVIEVEVGSR